MAVRPQKIWKLNHWKNNEDFKASIVLLAEPNEVRISSGPKTFISVRDDGITLSPGTGSSVNIQGMSQNFKYGGLLSDLPFPLSLVPSTLATPFPAQFFSPPLGKLISIIKQVSVLSAAFL